MKSSRLFVLLATAALLLFATATSAYAAGQGTVYGQAIMQPTVSLVLSGAGSDVGNPLVYSGVKGDYVSPSNFGHVTLTNDGQVDTPIMLGYGSNPTDGIDTWQLADTSSATSCVWSIWGNLGPTYVPGSAAAPRQLYPNFASGRADAINTNFRFPTTFNGSVHTMTALIIAGS